MIPILSYAAKTALGLSLFYAVYALFLRNDTHFHLNRAFLVAALALSFLIPAFPVASPFRVAPAVLDGISEAAGPLPARGLGLLDIAAIVYGLGALVFLLRFGVHLIRLAAVIRKNGIRRRDGARIVSVGADISPFSFLGFVFLNEHGLEAGDVRRILAHESVHIRQFHSLDLLLMELAVVVLWFNPLVWPYKKSLQETHEYLADAGVIAQGFGGSGYRRLVFEQHVGARLFGVGNSFKQSQIKRRMSMMSRNPSAGGSRWKCLLAVPAALALIAFFAVPRFAASATPAGQDKSGPSQPAKVSKEKAAAFMGDLNKIDQMMAELKADYKSTEDESARTGIKAKLEKLAQKRQELIAKAEEQGIPLPPPAPSVPSEEMMKLKRTAETIMAEMEKTDDPAVKADLEKKLKELKVKATALQEAGGPMVIKKKGELPPLDEIKAKLKSLQEKEAVVRAEMDKTDNAEKKNELKKTLQMVLEKQQQLKELAVMAEAKEAKVEK
ncbi:MAG: M56 family metallopeptidase [Acidobacteriota bacterium]|nr:M56 family metallopeptidase [Acidobacteriota bacterium]